MITKKQRLSIIYFLSRAVFLGVGYSLMFASAGKDAWLSIILGTLIGIIIVLAIKFVMKNKKDISLKEVFKKMKFWGVILEILYFLFLMFLMYECILIMQTMTTSFFLVNSPPLFVGATGAFLVIMTIKENNTTIFKVAEILAIIAVLTTLITCITLIPYGEIKAFLPALTASPKAILISSLYYTAISTGPILLALDFQDDGKHLIKTYLASSFFLLLLGLVIIAVLGPVLIQIYRFPEYMVLKRIKIMDFIEKVENIISIIWILDAFMILVTTTHNLKNLLPEKGSKIISSIILIILTIITGIVFGGNYILVLETYHLVPLILGIFIILILLPLVIYTILKHKKRRHSQL